MAKILIDTSRLNIANKFRGIGIYATNLSKYLSRVDKSHQYLLSASRAQGIDLIHYPYFDLFFKTLTPVKSVKQIVTVHDVIPLKFPKAFPPGIRGKIKFTFQKKALKKSDAIITDSNSSKQDIYKHLNIPKQKIFVVPLAASNQFKPTRTKPPLPIPDDYILYVGDVNHNKNLPTLLKSFSAIKNKKINLVLVSNAWSQPIQPIQKLNQLIRNLQLGSRITTISHSLETNQLASLYSHAKAYIQPSLYEGFGLPVLEALACGTPVVSSNTSSLPEVVGDAAILVKPTEKGVTNGINKVLKLTKTQRQQLVKRGFSQAKLFSWEKTALDTIKVYNQVLNHKQ